MVDSSRFLGGLLCAAIAIVAVIFLWGISAQSYWALAIPVMAGFLGVLAMGFWIGWTILTIKTVPPVAEPSPLLRLAAEKTRHPPFRLRQRNNPHRRPLKNPGSESWRRSRFFQQTIHAEIHHLQERHPCESGSEHAGFRSLPRTDTGSSPE